MCYATGILCSIDFICICICIFIDCNSDLQSHTKTKFYIMNAGTGKKQNKKENIQKEIKYK